MAPRPREIDRDQVFALAEKCGSLAEVARNAGWKPGSLRSRLDSLGLLEEVMDTIGVVQTPEPEGVTEGNDGSRTGVVAQGWTAEDVIRHFGDDPEECIVTTPLSATLWGNPEEPQERLKVSWIRKADTIQPADPSDWTPPPKPKKRKAQKYLDAVVISDHHAPHHERTFHRLFLDYLRDAQPGLIEVNGDLLDFSTISRHREREAYAQPVNECIQAGFQILHDYREVCPDAQIRLKRGNHEERLLHLILDNAKGLHNITPAASDVPALSLRRLLHLDELHVDYVDEEWDQAKTQIGPKLTVRHGFTTSRNAGNAMLDKLAGSTVQGHDHRLGMTLRTEHQVSDDDPLRVRMGVQGGCACIIPGGLGYVNGGQPDWANGCTAFRVWDDGDFHASVGVYVGGRFLAPNGERYA